MDAVAPVISSSLHYMYEELKTECKCTTTSHLHVADYVKRGVTTAVKVKRQERPQKRSPPSLSLSHTQTHTHTDRAFSFSGLYDDMQYLVSIYWKKSTHLQVSDCFWSGVSLLGGRRAEGIGHLERHERRTALNQSHHKRAIVCYTVLILLIQQHPYYCRQISQFWREIHMERVVSCIECSRSSKNLLWDSIVS